MSFQNTKIVQLIPQLAISGGIENFIRNLCSITPTDNIEISLITFFNQSSNEIITELKSKGYSVISLPKAPFERQKNRYFRFVCKNAGLDHFRKLRNIKKILRDINPDIIYVHGEDSELVGGFIAKQYNVVNVIHGENYFPLNPIFRLILTNISRKKYQFSIAVNKKIMTKLSIKGQKTTVVYPGIDISKFSKLNHETSNNKNICLGYLGRITKDKGIYQLIYAFNKISKKFQDIQFVIGGDGKEFNKTKKLIDDLGMTEKIEMIGEVNNKIEFFKKLDIFILPSESEGFPFTILEALASGIPVLATNVGGIHEVIKNNHNGLLLDSNRSEKIATAIFSLLENPQKLIQLKSNCLNSIKEYNIQNFVNNFYYPLKVVNGI